MHFSIEQKWKCSWAVAFENEYEAIRCLGDLFHIIATDDELIRDIEEELLLLPREFVNNAL